MSDLSDLKALDQPWNPWSHPEALWHGCPGHQWERLRWHTDLSRGKSELITRCTVCGAPRCSVYNSPREPHSDNEHEGYRCTAERHHSDEHDFLFEEAA